MAVDKKLLRFQAVKTRTFWTTMITCLVIFQSSPAAVARKMHLVKYLGCMTLSSQKEEWIAKEESGNADVVPERVDGFPDALSAAGYKEQGALGGKETTIQLCVEECAKRGSRYSLLFFGLRCRCHDNIKSLTPVNQTMCYLRCHGNCRQRCGGYWAISVYDSKVKHRNSGVSWPQHKFEHPDFSPSYFLLAQEQMKKTKPLRIHVDVSSPEADKELSTSKLKPGKAGSVPSSANHSSGASSPESSSSWLFPVLVTCLVVLILLFTLAASVFAIRWWKARTIDSHKTTDDPPPRVEDGAGQSHTPKKKKKNLRKKDSLFLTRKKKKNKRKGTQGGTEEETALLDDIVEDSNNRMWTDREDQRMNEHTFVNSRHSEPYDQRREDSRPVLINPLFGEGSDRHSSERSDQSEWSDERTDRHSYKNSRYSEWSEEQADSQAFMDLLHSEQYDEQTDEPAFVNSRHSELYDPRKDRRAFVNPHHTELYDERTDKHTFVNPHHSKSSDERRDRQKFANPSHSKSSDERRGRQTFVNPSHSKSSDERRERQTSTLVNSRHTVVVRMTNEGTDSFSESSS